MVWDAVHWVRERRGQGSKKRLLNICALGQRRTIQARCAQAGRPTAMFQGMFGQFSALGFRIL